jgi:signal transduction histidine kinase
MTKLYPAKLLTVAYFSIIALMMVIIHFSVYELTARDLERLYASNRLQNIQSYAAEQLNNRPNLLAEQVEIQTQGKTDFDRNTLIFFDFSLIPDGFPNPDDIELDSNVEVKSGPDNHSYFVRKTEMTIAGNTLQAYFILDNGLYELSEHQLLSMHTKQLLISLALLLISLFAIIKIAAKLTNPIARFAQTLQKRTSNDLSDIPLPEGTATIELAKLVETFNQYQQKIKVTMERERAFNRYASHELRSPLMVMTGAVNLLEEFAKDDFVKSQCVRLKKSIVEMTEFVETLLSLTKSETGQDDAVTLLSERHLTDIVSAHEHLIGNKPVTWTIKVEEDVKVNMPEAAFHILLGNIVKNAFAYTDEGKVLITVNKDRVTVLDSGKGVNSGEVNIEGFGLGLLLVRDICHRYGWTFELNKQNQGGSIAEIRFKRH